MKAAVLVAMGQPLSIEHVELDDCLDDEVRIRVVASGLCHSDYHLMSGDLPLPVPAVLGHEVAGVVEQVGSSVRALRPGDAVVTSLSSFCGHCKQCAGGYTHRCNSKPVRPAGARPRLTWKGQAVRQMGGLGGFAETMLVHQSAVVKMPEGMPLDRASLLGCSVSTGVGAVVNSARLRPGETAAVIGCGGVGLNVIQGARLSGASMIIAIDQVPAKLELARRFGATHTLLAQDGVAEAVIELTQGGVDHAFEAIGLEATMATGLSMLATGGLLTLIGVPRMGARLQLPGALQAVLAEKRIHGSLMGSSAFQHDLPWLAGLYLKGDLLLDELLTQRLPLEAINDGFADMLAGRVARSVVVFDA